MNYLIDNALENVRHAGQTGEDGAQAIAAAKVVIQQEIDSFRFSTRMEIAARVLGGMAANDTQGTRENAVAEALATADLLITQSAQGEPE